MEYLRRRDSGFVVSIVLLILAGFVAVRAYELGIGAMRAPGPGFVIFWTAIGLGLLSFRMLVSSLLGRSGQGESWGEGSLGRVASVVLALLVYAFALEHAGFVLTTLVFTAFSFWLLAEDRSRWGRIIVGSLLATLMTYVVFSRGFGVQLPRGWLTFF
jgi:hypothetical protein